MAFRLTQGESLEKGIRRIVGEEIESAVFHLRKEDEAARDQGIHEARKSIKKLRAITRLLMPGLGTAGTRDNCSLRDTGRALSKLRDAAALIETVESLSESYFSDSAMEQLAVVRSALRRRMEDTVRGEDCRTVIGGAVASLRNLKKRTHQWQFGAPSGGGAFAAIAPGIETTYRRGRKRLKVAQADPTAENLHRLRKRIKDHWYQVRLLGGAHSTDRELRQLQDWLGDHHNLAVLRDAIQSEPGAFGGKKMVLPVVDLVTRAQGELRKQALAAAAGVYLAKPKVHMLATSAAWDLWHKTGSLSSGPVPMQPGSDIRKRRGSAA